MKSSEDRAALAKTVLATSTGGLLSEGTGSDQSAVPAAAEQP